MCSKNRSIGRTTARYSHDARPISFFVARPAGRLPAGDGSVSFRRQGPMPSTLCHCALLVHQFNVRYERFVQNHVNITENTLRVLVNSPRTGRRSGQSSVTDLPMDYNHDFVPDPEGNNYRNSLSNIIIMTPSYLCTTTVRLLNITIFGHWRNDFVVKSVGPSTENKLLL